MKSSFFTLRELHRNIPSQFHQEDPDDLEAKEENKSRAEIFQVASRTSLSPWRRNAIRWPRMRVEIFSRRQILESHKG